MSSYRDTLIAWINTRIAEMLAAPPMWGSNEAVELQFLLLTELRALALRPEQELANPRRVLDLYVTLLQEKFPNDPPSPLFRLQESRGNDPTSPDFAAVLKDLDARIRANTPAPNPFAHSQVAIRLTFEDGAPPTASAVTGYYEEFRRATRASARTAATRRQRDIDHATDFTLEESIVSPPNGAPGTVLLRLGIATGQRDFVAEDRVRDGLTSVVTLAEWASTTEPVSELGLDDPARRTHSALQAMRLLPRRGVAEVAVGGKLIARDKPVELRRDHEARFLAVVGENTAPVPFDETEEIRAIDLDRGLLRLGRARTACYVDRELLATLSEVGVIARIQGRLYTPTGGKPFVIATEVTTDT